MGGAANWKIDHDNDAVRPALVLENGDKKWPAPPSTAKKPEAAAPAPKPVEAPKPQPLTTGLPAPVKSHGPALSPPSRAQGVALSIVGLVTAAAWLSLRYGYADPSEHLATFKLLQHVTVFVMAVFVGFQVVWNVTAALHTPLMSVTNAISGIIVVGGLLNGHGELHTPVIVAVVATLFATINISGGFIVTRRMLAMFRK